MFILYVQPVPNINLIHAGCVVEQGIVHVLHTILKQESDFCLGYLRESVAKKHIKCVCSI